MGRTLYLVVSGLIALVVFAAGVYVGANLGGKQVVERVVLGSDYCQTVGTWIEHYEELVKPYRELLPYRLEEGNFDPRMLDRYEFLLYQYYILYRDSWKTCHLAPPILYLAPVGAVDCGRLLDEIKNEQSVVIFPFIADENIETSKTLMEYYNFDGNAILVICNQRVGCEKNEILRALERC